VTRAAPPPALRSTDLNDDAIDMLQTIPDWDWNKQTDEETNAGVEFISAFYAEHGYYPSDPPTA